MRDGVDSHDHEVFDRIWHFVLGISLPVFLWRERNQEANVAM